MDRGRFVLFYNAPDDPNPAVPYEHDSDSLIDVVKTACLTNFIQDRGAKALRVEQSGRTILEEATLLEIADRARMLEESTLAENRFLEQVDLRDLVSRIMREMGLIDERGEPVTPDDDNPGAP